MRNSRILEKALDQDDIFFEYGANDKTNEYLLFPNSLTSSSIIKKLYLSMVETGQAFKLHYEYLDEKLRNRVVTWMDWSPQVEINLYFILYLQMLHQFF